MFQGKSHPAAKPPPKPKPPCEVCGAQRDRFDAWGTFLCTPCLDAWMTSPERRAAEKQLYPMPLWQMQRLKAAGKEPPPLPAEEMITAEYSKAMERWREGQRAVRGVAW